MAGLSADQSLHVGQSDFGEGCDVGDCILCHKTRLDVGQRSLEEFLLAVDGERWLRVACRPLFDDPDC